MYNALYENENTDNFNSKPPIIASIKRSRHSNVSISIVDSFSSLQKVNSRTYVPPAVMPSVAAAQWTPGFKGLDTRPRLHDNLSKKFCLVDSGSAITAVAAGPNDTVNPHLSLVAANGTLIECCGYKEIEIKMGRKSYTIRAAIAKIEETILGWDFIKKYRLSFYWDNFGECYLFDRRAGIKKWLQFVAIPHQSLFFPKRKVRS